MTIRGNIKKQADIVSRGKSKSAFIRRQLKLTAVFCLKLDNNSAPSKSRITLLFILYVAAIIEEISLSSVIAKSYPILSSSGTKASSGLRRKYSQYGEINLFFAQY